MVNSRLVIYLNIALTLNMAPKRTDVLAENVIFFITRRYNRVKEKISFKKLTDTDY